MPKILVILNPHARRNRRWGATGGVRMQRVLGSWGRVCETPTLDDLRATLERFERPDYLVCCGGDGSLHWAVNTAVQLWGTDPRRLPVFVPTRGGTIDFVASKAGIVGTPDQVLGSLVKKLERGAQPRIATLDTLSIHGVPAFGASSPCFSRIGFALAAGGIGERFFDEYYLERQRGRRAIAKIVSRAVTSHLSEHAGLPLPEHFRRYGRELFRPTRARVFIDGQELPMTEHRALHAGSIDVNFKGLFRVFPLARREGVLHFQVGSIPPGALLRALPSLYMGIPIRAEGLMESAGSQMRVSALEGEILNPIIDGERFRQLIELTVDPGPAIRVPRLNAPQHWVS